MKRITYILLFASLLLPIALKAQTPYDSFAPETSRPMLEEDALYHQEATRSEVHPADTLLCVAVVDMQHQTMLLVDIASERVIAVAPITDDLRKWLSVDPLVDKNIATSPYMYCNGNPIKYVDPNGKWPETAWDIANVMMDAASLVSNVKNGNTRDAVVDGVGLVMDVTAAIVPFVPGGAGTAINAYRTANKVSDVNQIRNQGQKVKGIGNYIIPNNGKSKPHGGKTHNTVIDNTIDHLPKGAKNVRKNQTQVDAKGNKIGNNRPDIQYDLNGTHYNVEIDNNPARSAEHGRVLKQNDPNSQVILILIE